MKNIPILSHSLAAATALLISAELLAAEETLIIEEESELLLIENGADSEELSLDIEEGEEESLLLEDASTEDQSLEQEFEFAEEDSVSEDIDSENNAFENNSPETALEDEPLLKLDQLWAETNHFGDSNASADNQSYLHGKASLNWNRDQWEVKASARFDAYSQNGDQDFDDAGLDYDETYIRYRTANSATTIGAQKIIWGRIDEFPPTDRLSTQDLRRVALDDLEDRRLASPTIRYEHFFEDSKLDIVAYPSFREAQLPDRDSTWFPVNRDTGDILGLKTNAALEAVVKTAAIKENAPNSEGGIGARFSSLGPIGDYAVTVQRGRASVPYFAFNPATNTIEGRYPRNWMVGGDIAMEALGGTLKLEGNWLSDTPVTRKDGRYTTAESVSWGVALELFPGDGDARLNLQLTGQNLLGAPSTIDRQEIYSFNGSFETPFADNNWRAKARFNMGLDEKDIYLNPELAYTGLEAQEIYLELHYFDGREGTVGDFYQDNSVAALGWRIDL